MKEMVLYNKNELSYSYYFEKDIIFNDGRSEVWDLGIDRP